MESAADPNKTTTFCRKNFRRSNLFLQTTFQRKTIVPKTRIVQFKQIQSVFWKKNNAMAKTFGVLTLKIHDKQTTGTN